MSDRWFKYVSAGKMPEWVSNIMLDRMPKRMFEYMSDKRHRMFKIMSARKMPEWLSDKMQERMPDRMSQCMFQKCQVVDITGRKWFYYNSLQCLPLVELSSCCFMENSMIPSTPLTGLTGLTGSTGSSGPTASTGSTGSTALRALRLHKDEPHSPSTSDPKSNAQARKTQMFKWPPARLIQGPTREWECIHWLAVANQTRLLSARTTGKQYRKNLCTSSCRDTGDLRPATTHTSYFHQQMCVTGQLTEFLALCL
jgi:hypothetical protein